MVKRFLALTLIVLLIPLTASAQWITSGIMTNPAANTIFAEFIAPADNNYRCSFLGASTVGAIVFYEWRNTTNTANVVSQAFPLPAMTPFAHSIPIPLFLLANERVRIRLSAAITGQAQGSLFCE